MSESSQHGSQDEHRNRSSGDRRSGAGAGRDGDRSNGAPRRRFDDNRRSFSRDARDGDRSTGYTGGRPRSGGDGGRPAEGDRRRDDRRGGSRGGFGDGRRDDRRGDSRGEGRGGYGAGRRDERPGQDDRRDFRGGDRGPRREGENRREGYPPRRDDNRSQGRGGFGGGRTEDRRGGYRGDQREEHRGGFGGGRRDDRPGQGGGGYRGGHRDERRGGFGGDRRDDRRGGYGDRRGDSRGEGRGGYGAGRRDERPGGYRDRPAYDRADVSTHRHRAPEIDEDITGRELDKPTRAQLGALEPRNADAVAKHLVMTGRYLLDDPELALEHAQAAGRRGGRIAAVREATGVAAYEAGDYGLALKELRTYRRMTGSEVHLPLMVDCERALGRLDKAAELATSEAAQTLEPGEKVELAIVLAGMRRDQGDAQGAVDALTIPQLDRNRGFSYSPRLFRAYAEALRGVGRDREALGWDRQAVVAEAALGTGQFAEPEIFDLVGEEPEPAEEGIPLADPDRQDHDADRAAGSPGETVGATVPEPSAEASPSDGLGDGTDDESEDVLDEGLEEDLDPDDDFEGDFEDGSEGDLDPDDDADLAEEAAADGGAADENTQRDPEHG